jgi:hypothetical protein
MKLDGTSEASLARSLSALPALSVPALASAEPDPIFDFSIWPSAGRET